MSETMQTTLAKFDKGDEITFNDRVQPLTVTSVHTRSYNSGRSETALRVEGPRGGVYRLSASTNEHKEPTVRREISSSVLAGERSEWGDEEELESVRLETPASEIEPPVEVGEEYKKQFNVDGFEYTGEWSAYRIVSIDRESQQVEVRILDQSSGGDVGHTMEIHYQDVEDRLESWVEIDEIESDPDVEDRTTDDEDSDDEDAGVHHCDVADREVTLGARDRCPHCWEPVEELGDDEPELVTDGGYTVDDVCVGDVIELPNGGRFAIIEIEEWVLEPDEYHARAVDGEKKLEWRTHHVETALESGATLEPNSFDWVGADVEIEEDPQLVTDGGFTDDDPRSEWCPECQRYRIGCRHTRTLSTDGGSTAVVSDTTNVSGIARSGMVDYKRRAQELADETSLTEAEARVASLKESGLSHAEIADEIELSKSTVDEYSRRINRRFSESRRTIEELEDLLGGRL